MRAAQRDVESKRPVRRLLLASRSPRRRQLLDEHGFAHGVVSSGLDDSGLRPGRVTPEQWVLALAHLKARAGLSSLLERRGNDEPDTRSAGTRRHAEPVLLAADTVVVKGDELIGQPNDADDALRIVSTLSNGEHCVLTGVAIAASGGVRWLLDSATVGVGDIGRERIEAYVETGDWRGKAGGYNLVERLDDGWPIRFVGDATSIMGLPMKRLRPVLDALLSEGAAS